MVSATSSLPTEVPWKCVVLDWYSRKHTHVVRSTFAAELHALLDALGQAALINLTVHEMRYGSESVDSLAKLQESGNLWPPLDAFIDAKAVFDAIVSDPVRMPTERHLYIHLLAAKDALNQKSLHRLVWIDTLDMLSDGMTKGSVDRKPLLTLASSCTWQLHGQSPVEHAGVKPALSSKADEESQPE